MLKKKKMSKKDDENDENDSSSNDENDEKDDVDCDDDLFTVKANHNWKDEATTNNNDDNSNSDNDQLIAENVLAKLMNTNNKLKKKKAPKLKINDVNNTEAVKTMRIAGATKITFDEDGEQQLVHKLKLRTLKNDNNEDDSENDSDSNDSDDEDEDNTTNKANNSKSKTTKSSCISTSSIDAIKSKEKATAAKVLQHTKQIKARLDMSRAEDEEQDKLRVKEIHRLRRMRNKIQQQPAAAGKIKEVVMKRKGE